MSSDLEVAVEGMVHGMVESALEETLVNQQSPDESTSPSNELKDDIVSGHHHLDEEIVGADGSPANEDTPGVVGAEEEESMETPIVDPLEPQVTTDDQTTPVVPLERSLESPQEPEFTSVTVEETKTESPTHPPKSMPDSVATEGGKRRVSVSAVPASAPVARSVEDGPMKSKSAITEAVRATNPILEELLYGIQLLQSNDPSMKVMDFKDSNIFQIAHGSALAAALETNSHLETLILENAKVQTVTATEIARALAKNPNSSLKLLNLENNHIQPAGMKAIAELLDTNTSLVELKVSRQKYPTGADAEQTFARSLEKKNFSLLKLSLQIRDVPSRDKCDKYITRNKEIVRKNNMKSGDTN